MVQYIPVVYAICESQDVPHRAESSRDADSFMEKAYNDPAAYHMHMATAARWWQIQGVTEMRDRDGISGLQFFDREIAILSDEELQPAIDGVTNILQAYLDDDEEAEPVTIDAEQVTMDIDCDDNPPVGFVLFLTSMIKVLQEALRTEKSFIFIQLQP